MIFAIYIQCGLFWVSMNKIWYLSIILFINILTGVIILIDRIMLYFVNLAINNLEVAMMTAWNWTYFLRGLNNWKTWWPQEQPSVSEYKEAIYNLQKHNWKVEYVISHTTSLRIMEGPLCYPKENTKLNEFFNDLEVRLDYKYWYFGHFHQDKDFPDYKCRVLYRRIINI